MLVDFWTYSCINCQRSIPHVEAWSKAYQQAGLQVIGVHTPEFTFEQDPAKVIQVSGTPNSHTVLTSPQQHSGVLTMTLSPGLQAYDLTFG